MLRYKLRTLMILLAVGPPLLAVAWQKWHEWRLSQEILLSSDLEEWNYLPAEHGVRVIWDTDGIDGIV